MIRLLKILVAVDFSEHTEAAVLYASELAKAFEAEVLLCHVVAPPELISQLHPGEEGYFPPNLPELQTKAAQQECRDLLAKSGIAKGRILIEQGTPFVEIVRTARNEQVDLIIVGTHGRGAVAHMLLGSVAERVVRKAPCPVLVVRKGEHDFALP